MRNILKGHRLPEARGGRFGACGAGILGAFLFAGVVGWSEGLESVWGSPAALPAREGPLSGLPSAPGTHLQKIAALGNDQWLRLETPAPDPKWGRARGRSWGGRALISAPDLGAAFFFGEGPHALVKPDGHIMDDLWAYDINANRWIAVYPGTDTTTFNQRVSAGQLVIDNLAAHFAGKPLITPV